MNSPFVGHAMRGAALVVTDRRWAAPLSAAALGLGIFSGVAIGPGAAGTLATGARQIVEIPSSSEGDGQSGGGGGPVASTGSSPSPAEGEGGAFEEAIPATPLAPEAAEPALAPAPEPAPKPKPPAGGKDGEAEESETQELKGTVAHANPAAGSYALAIAGGELVSIHTPKLPAPGTKLIAPARRLANGTFAEAGEIEKEKQATQVEFRGVVTFADPDPAAPTYTVSGRGSSLLVHVPPDPTGAVPGLLAIGSYVTVTAKVDDGLWQEKVEGEPGPPSTYLDLAGIVKEVLPDGHLTFSVDWTAEAESVLTLTVPPNIDSAKLKPGDSYLATATVEPDGSLKLSGIASDEHTKGADDPTGAQGDLAR